MALNFTPKPGKPHIKIYMDNGVCYLWPFNLTDPIISVTNNPHDWSAMSYCSKVNFGHYKTQGEAARALHYGSEKK